MNRSQVYGKVKHVAAERRRERTRRYGRARDRALRRLAERHPDEYRSLYNDEMCKLEYEPLPGDPT